MKHLRQEEHLRRDLLLRHSVMAQPYLRSLQRYRTDILFPASFYEACLQHLSRCEPLCLALFIERIFPPRVALFALLIISGTCF